MQPVSGVLSTQKARTPGCDSQHLYTGEGLLTLRDTARAEASCASAASSSELSTCSTRFAIWRRFCWSPVAGLKMWLAQILARCPVLLQFRHTISDDTLHSFTVCAVLPHRLHLPWKKASASSRLLCPPLGRAFLAGVARWFLWPVLGGFLCTAYACPLLCSSQRFDRSHPLSLIHI